MKFHRPYLYIFPALLGTYCKSDLRSQQELRPKIIKIQSDDALPAYELQATVQGAFSLQISWPRVADALHYRIDRDGKELGEVGPEELTYTDSGLRPKTTYTYEVIALGQGKSVIGRSEPAAVTTDAATGPQLYAASCAACHGELAQSTRRDYSVAQINDAIKNLAEMRFLDGKLDDESLALIAQALSSSRQDLDPPRVPAGLTAAVAGAHQINLSWSHDQDTNTTGRAGYKIYRDGTAHGEVGADANSFSDVGLTALTQYSYQVSAFNGQGAESERSTPWSTLTSTA